MVAGSDVVSDWFTTYAADRYASLRAKFDVRMNYLRQQPAWKDPHYHQLRGQDGVGAVRFEVRNVQYRPLGFFGPGARTFTFVFFATEKNGKYLPKAGIEDAKRRMRQIETNVATSRVVQRWSNA